MQQLGYVYSCRYVDVIDVGFTQCDGSVVKKTPLVSIKLTICTHELTVPNYSTGGKCYCIFVILFICNFHTSVIRYSLRTYSFGGRMATQDETNDDMIFIADDNGSVGRFQITSVT